MSDIFTGSTFAEQKDYLLKRGIDEILTKRLRLEITGPTRLKELGFSFKDGLQRAILFPIFTLDGGTDSYGARCFYNKTFGKDSRAKFLHPPSSGGRPPSLYFSPLVNWDRLEYGQRIFLCESYIKANIAAKLGFHAIGVSGCWGWSHKQEIHWALEELDWQTQALVPTILMDSDVNYDNPKLSAVLRTFEVKSTTTLGVKPEFLELPAPPSGDKWGLDDYFMHHGEQATLSLLAKEAEPIESALSAHLKQMNSEVVYVHEVGKFADIKRNVLMGRGQFEDAAFATRKIVYNDKPVKVAKVWTEWNRRNEVDSLKYKPGQPRIVESNDESESYFNLWRGWGCQPLVGDPSYFTTWLEDAFPSEVDRAYFLDWWSYQVQYPGTKLNTALMLVGPSGVGKGWMASVAERIFGSDNTWKCNLSDLESRFNSGLGAAQLLVIEEADVTGGVKVYNTLKDMVTNEHIRYERKGVDAIKVDNCLNIFLNSNHINVLQLDEFDRRFAVLEITNQSIANDLVYWEPRWDWLREGGASIIFHYFHSRTISESFNPHGEAPWSQAKADMIESTHNPIDTWVREHVIRGEEIYIKGTLVDGSLMTAKELMFCYLEGNVPLHEVDRRQSMSMVKALNSARARVANYGKKIKYEGVPMKYYWVGTPQQEIFYQDQLDQRLFWRRLVASLQGEVASESDAGYQDTKY